MREPNYIDSNDVPASLITLNRSVFENDHQAVVALLKDNPDLINQIVMPIYKSPLSSALSRNEVDYPMLALLVNYGVSFNYPINHHRILPIESACKSRNKDLLVFLLDHGARLTPLSAHNLLASTSDINQLTKENIETVYRMIKLMGGLDSVAGLMDGENTTFRENAERCLLINPNGGSLSYDFMELLTIAEDIDLAENSRVIDGLLVEFQKKIDEISGNYANKAKTDITALGRSITSFFNTGGNVISERDIPSNVNRSYLKN